MYSLHVVSKDVLPIAYEWYKNIADDTKIAHRLCSMFGENCNIETKLDFKTRMVNIRREGKNTLKAMNFATFKAEMIK